MVNGEERSNARNIRALLIELRDKQYMRRSKLEMNVDILEILVHWGPLKLTHVMYKANLNSSSVREYLDFLTKQGLVEEKTLSRERKVYLTTQPGVRVLKYFRELKEELPIVEETGTPRSRMEKSST